MHLKLSHEEVHAKQSRDSRKSVNLKKPKGSAMMVGSNQEIVERYTKRKSSRNTYNGLEAIKR
jgi:hypothetical protein